MIKYVRDFSGIDKKTLLCNKLKIITIVDIPLMQIRIQVSLDILGCASVHLFYLININVLAQYHLYTVEKESSQQ